MSREEPQNLTVTPISDIRKKSEERKLGEIISLPSGINVRLRRPDLIPLLKEGKISAELISTLQEQASDHAPRDLDGILKNLEAVETILLHAFVEPKLTLSSEPGEGEISIDDLTDEDRGVAYLYAQAGIKDQKFFRNPDNFRSGRPSVQKVSREETKRLSGD